MKPNNSMDNFFYTRFREKKENVFLFGLIESLNAYIVQKTIDKITNKEPNQMCYLTPNQWKGEFINQNINQETELKSKTYQQQHTEEIKINTVRFICRAK